jgi:hypothetical protein
MLFFTNGHVGSRTKADDINCHAISHASEDMLGLKRGVQ